MVDLEKSPEREIVIKRRKTEDTRYLPLLCLCHLLCTSVCLPVKQIFLYIKLFRQQFVLHQAAKNA